MPIASGAAGRVDVGVDASTAWTPYGLKRKTIPAKRNCDSYLQRYQEWKKKNQSNILKNVQENQNLSDHENDGATEENPQQNISDEDHSSGKPSSEEKSKKSRLCVLL